MPPKTKIKKPQRNDRAKRKIGMPQSGKKRKYSKKKKADTMPEASRESLEGAIEAAERESLNKIGPIKIRPLNFEEKINFRTVMYQSDQGQILTKRQIHIAGKFMSNKGDHPHYHNNPYGNLLRVYDYLHGDFEQYPYQEREAITQLNKILKYPQSEKEYEIISRFAYSIAEDNSDEKEYEVTDDNIEAAFKDWVAYEVKSMNRADGSKIDTPNWYIQNLIKLFTQGLPVELYSKLGKEIWERRKKQIISGTRKAVNENEENIKDSGEIIKFGTGLEKEVKGEISKKSPEDMTDSELEEQIARNAEALEKHEKIYEILNKEKHTSEPPKKKKKPNHISVEPDTAEITETIAPVKKKVKKAIMRTKKISNKAATVAYMEKMKKIKAIDKKIALLEQEYKVSVPSHVKAHLSLPAPIPPKPLPKISLPPPVPPKPLPPQPIITHVYPKNYFHPEKKKELASKSSQMTPRAVSNHLISIGNCIFNASQHHGAEEKAINKAYTANTHERKSLEEAKEAHALEGVALKSAGIIKNKLMHMINTQ
jgi:hypothetical protein